MNTLILLMQQELKNVSIEEEYNTDMYSEDIDKHQLQILKDEVDNYKQHMVW